MPFYLKDAVKEEVFLATKEVFMMKKKILAIMLAAVCLFSMPVSILETVMASETEGNFVFHAESATSEGTEPKYQTLSVGSTGDDVVRLQNALIEKNILNGAADGIYGNGTAGAVTAFQESMGIAATGSADSMTQEMLYGEYVEPEVDVPTALQEGTWLFNGGDDLILNGISFTTDTATIAQVYFDGNGKHENDSNDCSYTLNDGSIILSMIDGTEMEIPYEVKNGQLILNNGEWKSVSEVKAGLQGNWILEYEDFGSKYVYRASVQGDNFQSEKANSNGAQYSYNGPYEGNYTLNFGGFDADFMHSSEWYYNIINSEVVLLHYDHILSRTDTGLLGEGGYSNAEAWQ